MRIVAIISNIIAFILMAAEAIRISNSSYYNSNNWWPMLLVFFYIILNTFVILRTTIPKESLIGLYIERKKAEEKFKLEEIHTNKKQ